MHRKSALSFDRVLHGLDGFMVIATATRPHGNNDIRAGIRNRTDVLLCNAAIHFEQHPRRGPVDERPGFSNFRESALMNFGRRNPD
jgi:hypothetical protein